MLSSVSLSGTHINCVVEQLTTSFINQTQDKMEVESDNLVENEESTFDNVHIRILRPTKRRRKKSRKRR